MFEAVSDQAKKQSAYQPHTNCLQLNLIPPNSLQTQRLLRSISIMAYFTWKETGLTGDCASLEAMAARFEEAAALMRRMASEGFVLERHSDGQHITHSDAGVFAAYGFIDEQSPVRQLNLIDPD